MNLSTKELFMGRLGKEPDLRYTKTQKPVCYLSVATSREEEQKTKWNKVVVWGKQAELCNIYPSYQLEMLKTQEQYIVIVQGFKDNKLKSQSKEFIFQLKNAEKAKDIKTNYELYTNKDQINLSERLI